MPALEKAKKAVDSIKPADINELRGMRNATDTCRFIFDAVQLLFQDQMIPVEVGTLNMLKQETSFVKCSYEDYAGKKL